MEDKLVDLPTIECKKGNLPVPGSAAQLFIKGYAFSSFNLDENCE
jgi:hypothetical protein